MDGSWRLQLVRAAGVTIAADPSLREPYRASFQGAAPRVRVEAGTVALEYRRLRFPPFEWHAAASTVTLNGSVPWRIEARGGLAHVTATLEGVQLLGFEVQGGARAIVLSLPRPWGTVPVRLSSGVSDLTVHRPARAGARVEVNGGSQHLVFDDQRLGAVGGRTVWQSANYDTAANRYDITILRGARDVTVDAVEPADARRQAAERMLVTVLFTDIVGSTGRAAELGDRRWRELLDAHDRLARELVHREGGKLVKTTGDGILAVFDGPGQAIRCAAALRAELRPLGLEVRAGLHTGEVERRGDDVGGIAVHIGARIMEAAAPGEVLVSRTVRDLVAGSGIALEGRGTRALRGVDDDWPLFAVSGGGVP
ncbi:MAG TPA: adenylate/guanylate cyclase domain-containing protein [Actinomycetes bacterium]